MSTINVNAIDKESGSTLTLGGSGTAVTLHASATSSGFVADGGVTVAKLSTSATEADNVKQRVAKAWINYNASSATISDGFNFSSITDNGVGNFTATFTVAMSNAVYAVAGTVGNSSKGVVAIGGGLATTAVQNIATREADTATYTDYSDICVTVFGDTA